jgi:uncharacterized protein (TIGR03086 family)
MPTDDADLVVLRRALDQMAQLLDDVDGAALSQPTPCAQWNVGQLVDHIVAAPAKFASMVRNESVDWSGPTPPAGADPAGLFRRHADDLVQAWHDATVDAEAPPVDWQCAELAVHTWDLATALGRSTDVLDPEVAERGLAFMQVALTDDNRGVAFAPPQPAPEGADPYARIAAFAGRSG